MTQKAFLRRRPLARKGRRSDERANARAKLAHADLNGFYCLKGLNGLQG